MKLIGIHLLQEQIKVQYQVVLLQFLFGNKSISQCNTCTIIWKIYYFYSPWHILVNPKVLSLGFGKPPVQRRLAGFARPTPCRKPAEALRSRRHSNGPLPPAKRTPSRSPRLFPAGSCTGATSHPGAVPAPPLLASWIWRKVLAAKRGRERERKILKTAATLF